MRKSFTVIMVTLIIFVSLGCSLTQYLSDSPPAAIETPKPTSEQTSQQNDMFCLSSLSLPPDYQPVDINDINQLPFDPQMIEDALSSFLSEAKLQSFDTYYSESDQSIINCMKISPLKSLEQTAFDFMINQRDNIAIMFGGDITIDRSTLTDQISGLGDSRAAYHITLPTSSNEMYLELIIVRENDEVIIASFGYQKSESLTRFSNLIKGN